VDGVAQKSIAFIFNTEGIETTESTEEKHLKALLCGLSVLCVKLILIIIRCKKGGLLPGKVM
jgi:hypothetical protein